MVRTALDSTKKGKAEWRRFRMSWIGRLFLSAIVLVAWLSNEYVLWTEYSRPSVSDGHRHWSPRKWPRFTSRSRTQRMYSYVLEELERAMVWFCYPRYGILFFGTPHQGGNCASLGGVAASIARLSLRNPTNSFMEALKIDSLFADDLVQDFRQQLEDYNVLSFYETLPFKKLGVVDPLLFTFVAF